jgi:hypothetical protein
MMNKILTLAVALGFIGTAHAQKGTDIATAALLHQEYTDVIIASDSCPGVALDINKWDAEVRKTAGTSGPGMIKAFEVSDQGGAWRDKRQDDFKANPNKECAEVMDTYGPKGKGLLKRK